MSKLKVIRALSIAQPWAECIVAKGKNVENRDWNTWFRGYFAVHASRSKSGDRFEACSDSYGIRLDPADLVFGAIVGFAELVAVITKAEVSRKTHKWFVGEYGFVLSNVVRLRNPVPAKGSLSFWKLEGRALSAALGQLNSSQVKQIASRPLSKLTV